MNYGLIGALLVDAMLWLGVAYGFFAVWKR